MELLLFRKRALEVNMVSIGSMSSTSDVGEIERLLLEEDEIIEIKRDNNWDLPDIDFNKWDISNRERIEGIISELFTFLTRPYIIDSFGSDHSRRRAYSGDLRRREDGKVRKYYRSTALRMNNIDAADIFLCSLSYLLGYQGEDKDELGAQIRVVRDAVHSVKQEYNGKNTEQKILEVGHLKERISELLMYMSNQNADHSSD